MAVGGMVKPATWYAIGGNYLLCLREEDASAIPDDPLQLAC